jgi:arylsulfatase A-like enzyme
MSAHTIGKRQTLFSKFQPHKSYAHHMSGKPEQQYTNHYDNGVLQADAVIHELITLLQTKKYLKNALVVITADHGESLGEHQLFSHANSVQEELLRTPLLIIDFADNSPLSIKAPSFISQVDISPTILHELKMAIPTSWYGHPIQLNDVQNKKDDFTFFQLLPNIGLYDHRQPNKLFKYWVNIQTGEEYAFDLSVDAKEQHNIIWQVPAELKYEWRKTAYATQLH